MTKEEKIENFKCALEEYIKAFVKKEILNMNSTEDVLFDWGMLDIKNEENKLNDSIDDLFKDI